MDGSCYACRGVGDCPPNPCASDVTCLGGECRYEASPAGSACPSGVCDGLEPAPACVACRSADECDDGDPCTVDRCDDATCTHTPSCDDGSPPMDGGVGSTPSGCGCRGASSGASAPAWLGFALVLAAARLRRRAGR